MSEPLPELLDAKRVQAELGVTRAVAEKLMRRLPLVVFEDVRKVYVRRADVAALIDVSTFAKDSRPVHDAGTSKNAPATRKRPGARPRRSAPWRQPA